MELDALRKSHQAKVMAGEPETDAELEAYQRERDVLVMEYEQDCGPLS